MYYTKTLLNIMYTKYAAPWGIASYVLWQIQSSGMSHTVFVQAQGAPLCYIFVHIHGGALTNTHT